MRSQLAAALAVALLSCSFLDPNVGALQLCNGPSGDPYSGADGGGGDAGFGLTMAGGAADHSAATAPSPATYGSVTGNLLISDQYNNRVLEMTRHGDIVWSFGDGSDVPGPGSVVAPNDAERLPGGRTLIVGTGAALGGEAGCGRAACPDNRVFIVDDRAGTIVWVYGNPHGAAGNAPGLLRAPVAAVLVTSGADAESVLITDQGNDRVIEVSEKTKSIVWSFPPPGSGESLHAPNSAERLPDGHTLIADSGGNRVLEVDARGRIAWSYPLRPDPSILNGPSFASRLPNGNTLVADAGDRRVVEIDASTPPRLVWSYSAANRNPCGPPPSPSHAVRLADDHTLIADPVDDQILEVDHETPAKLLYTYGRPGIEGRGPGLLAQPYDAKVVGDFTGLTPPG